MSPWESFFQKKIQKIFSEKRSVLDIGGGLRISKEKGNRYDASRAWLLPLVEQVKYTFLDPVPDYNPDIIGDIHNLPLGDNTQDAVICIAVLEHVKDPIRACEEIWRVLKTGGYCFVYLPFLYYYHASGGYYGDYWRFTLDAIDMLFKKFSHKEIQSVRGATETWLHLSPLGKSTQIARAAALVDRLAGKVRSKQVSGYHVFLIK